jgi:AcrR family transcriptional regulator
MVAPCRQRNRMNEVNMSVTMSNESPSGVERALLVGAPRPLLSRRAEAALGARHRSVLDGLEQLMRDGDLTALTIGEIAARLECSRRTLYELAPSKEQLILLVLDRVMHRIGETAIAAVDFEAPAPVQLRQYATASLGYVFRSSALDDLSDIAGARRVLDIHHRFAATLLERIVATGIDRGELRRVDASVAAAVILGSAVHLASPDVLDDLGLSLEDAIDEMLELVLGGLRAD